MCGIVGFAGNAPAAPILLDGLAKLEYRGYDSAGICTFSGGALHVAKKAGELKNLAEATHDGADLPGVIGIGHTRWATHGAPSDATAHPHLSADGKIAVVHNGIIENYLPLKEMLLQQGVTFQSDTDTEVASNLIALYYARCHDFLRAVRMTREVIVGSYALVILCADEPDTIIAMKQDSPMIYGRGEGCNFIASDVPAILKYTRDVVYMVDGDMVVMTADSVKFLDRQGREIRKETEHIAWELSDAEKGGFEHFMLKEIHEQPSALSKTLSPHIQNGRVVLEGLSLDGEYLQKLSRIYVVACGSAYYVGCLGKYILEKLCRIPVEPMLASEFRYCDPLCDENTLVLIISQSGETADTKAALLEAKRRGARTLAIVNVVGSSITEEAAAVIYTWAGPEIAVATTKAYSTQVGIVYLLGLYIADILGTVSQETYHEILTEVQALPEKISAILTPEKIGEIWDYAKRFHTVEDAYFIGRHVDNATCLEGSLKLKEIAYIHSEAYAAGELKHGPISLIEQGTLVIAVATNPDLFDKTMSNVKETLARGAEVLCVTVEGMEEEAKKTAHHVILVPKTLPLLQGSLSVIPLQLLSYYVSLEEGGSIDKPRNLAKSVTVE